MTVELRDLSGSVVIITGAGSGIGAATARQLLGAGANLVAGDLRAAALASLLGEWGPERVVGVVGDVGDPGTAEELVGAGVAAWGRVDSVVANAGVGFYGGVLDMSTEQIRTMVSTNFLGTVWLARAAISHYRERTGGGDVIILGSVAGLGAGGGKEAVYAGTKAAQIQFGRSLDREVRVEGIRVAVMAPAGAKTAFAAGDGRFGDARPEDSDFLETDDIAFALTTMLRQPRRLRTALWEMWSLSEAAG